MQKIKRFIIKFKKLYNNIMNTEIIFDLENENGFFCVFFFFLSTYIYCRKNNKLLYFKDDNWKFVYNKGLEDYFILNDYIKKYNENNNNTSDKSIYSHMKEPSLIHPLSDYKLYSKELYNIRPEIIHNYELPLIYNSIFIRGGDKLLYEAQQHPISQYVSFLLNLNTNINDVFVHSDDNLIVNDVQKYIIDNKIPLNVYKITKNNCNGGAVVMKRLNYGKCANIKSVDSMNSEEKKEHVFTMLNAIEIMRKSKNVILSYDSNVSRFIKINFDCNVYSINNSDKFMFDLNTINPAYL
jgi:hypothetical protein